MQLAIPFDKDSLEEKFITFNKFHSQDQFHSIIGQSDEMSEIFSLVKKIADSDCNVVIHGESGTGKELIAKSIHCHSYRCNKPFVAINCGAIPENLLESELFGHVRGAFTGASAAKSGKFELADGGTIFLDEIGDMSPELQVKLLRVLEEREVERVGSSKSIKVDIRIIAATHKNLEEEVDKNNFREDLFYRLFVVPIYLPPLRNRRFDIPVLISYFIDIFNKKNNRYVEEISNEAMELLLNYYWPGNVRELKNLVERLVVLSDESIIEENDLPHKYRHPKKGVSLPNINLNTEGICLATEVNEFEKALIMKSLEKTKGIKNRAAKLLHLNRTTLVEKIKRHNLQTYPN